MKPNRPEWPERQEHSKHCAYHDYAKLGFPYKGEKMCDCGATDWNACHDAFMAQIAKLLGQTERLDEQSVYDCGFQALRNHPEVVAPVLKQLRIVSEAIATHFSKPVWVPTVEKIKNVLDNTIPIGVTRNAAYAQAIHALLRGDV